MARVSRRRRERTGTAASAGAYSVASMWTTCAVVVLALSASASALDLQPGDLDENNTLFAPAEQYFIDRIFDKYGDKGVITFEVMSLLFQILLN